MENNKRILIERNLGVSIYGKIIDETTKKLGKFEVESTRFKNNGAVFSNYLDAEKRRDNLIGVKQSNQ